MPNTQSVGNNWSCLPLAFCNVITLPLIDMLNMVGHDGSEILWPDQPEPQRRRAFHPDEIIRVMWDCGWAVTCFEAAPRSVPALGEVPYTVKYNPKDMERYMTGSTGVVIGTFKCGTRHAMNWMNGKLYDNGKINRSKFTLEKYYAVKMK